ncbi:polysaccharide deacetylase family protein [Sphingobacterium sp. JUb78]|uniref:polysaccharide deacetylase family protein n=1 Tax=Sphingobacterium sp. JUb78 TaxID=2485111 RepID=UPI0010E795D5|nr:polysaccharide deacetylase family protein [Sphingobacterium sp. JUb78]MCW2262350.1 peptidoglycan/xylan/chitin deacetylase (PgdA/CDA1 family) [Sphingobacterium kitahiroshimense]TCR12902.1 peptidoglycan/xylan/chitin deacetylase (PgdA/CDA1 family) [Sphingobacterium sp. JUb78]
MRGDSLQKQLALVFTGHDLADGGLTVLKILKEKDVKGSFFLTGDFLRTSKFRSVVKEIKRNKNYLSAHSDKHLLFSDWGNRQGLLVTKDSFIQDLEMNFRELEKLGFRTDNKYFIPSYEWYNQEIVTWSEQMGYVPINYTPGLRTAADYSYPEMGKRYLSSDDIEKGLWEQNKKLNGLNGFIILIHMGTDSRRKDKFYHRLGKIIDKLKKEEYQFVDIRELLQ